MTELSDKYKEALQKLKEQLQTEEETAKLMMMKERGKAKNKFKKRRKPLLNKKENTKTVNDTTTNKTET